MIDLGGDVCGNGISKLVFTILSAVAEAERDRTRERIAEVKRDQRIRGRFLGGTAPFGWRVGDAGELVEVPEQQKAIRTMVRMRKAGKSLRAIADAMRAQGPAISHVTVAEVIAAAEERTKSALPRHIFMCPADRQQRLVFEYPPAPDIARYTRFIGT